MIATKMRDRFLSNGFDHSYQMFTVVRRADPEPDEPPGPDEISVNVMNGSQTIAKASALLSRTKPGAAPQTSPYYDKAEEFGLDYAAAQLAKTGSGTYSPQTASVLNLINIEVAPGHRRNGVATAIMDRLLSATRPDYAAAVVLPCYTPQVNDQITNPAATMANEVSQLLLSLGFKSCGHVRIPSGGITPVSVMAFGKKL